MRTIMRLVCLNLCVCLCSFSSTCFAETRIEVLNDSYAISWDTNEWNCSKQIDCLKMAEGYFIKGTSKFYPIEFELHRERTRHLPHQLIRPFLMDYGQRHNYIFSGLELVESKKEFSVYDCTYFSNEGVGYFRVYYFKIDTNDANASHRFFVKIQGDSLDKKVMNLLSEQALSLVVPLIS